MGCFGLLRDFIRGISSVPVAILPANFLPGRQKRKCVVSREFFLAYSWAVSTRILPTVFLFSNKNCFGVCAEILSPTRTLAAVFSQTKMPKFFWPEKAQKETYFGSNNNLKYLPAVRLSPKNIRCLYLSKTLRLSSAVNSLNNFICKPLIGFSDIIYTTTR